ncbi:MAG: hypothetical protein LUG51_02080 [Tannerellaceae bacterium]|nr:hypothetical protein [Tannerellaceae bacterium]
MKKLLYLVSCIAFVQFLSAENKEQERPATFENIVAKESAEISLQADDEVFVEVPIPSVVNGGSVTVVNKKTGVTYTFSNGNAYYQTVRYYVPKGTYQVTATSVGTCSNGLTGVATFHSQYSTVLQVGVVFNIEYNGGLLFSCPK